MRRAPALPTPLALLGALACATGRGAAPLPPTGAVAGPLAIHVVYPAPADVVEAHDSTFLFGSVGRGDAALVVNGVPVPVHPDGAWIAWLPLPDDSVADFHLVAAAAGQADSTTVRLRLAPRFQPPDSVAAWIDTMSFTPTGRLAWPAGEGVRLAVRATPGATVRLVLPDSGSVPLVPDSLPAEPPPGIRAFGVDTATYHRPAPADRYVGWLPAVPVCPDTLAALATCATLEVVQGADTARAFWPLHVATLDAARPTVVVLDDDTAHTGTTDSLTVGRAVPGGTYHWFFPTGTTAAVSGRRNGTMRLALSRTAIAWVAAADAQPLPAGTPPPGGAVGTVRLSPGSTSVILRVPLPARLPFRVEEGDRTLALRLYGAVSDVNWMQYGKTDPLITRLDYRQDTRDELVITLELSRRVWGYRARYDGRDLLLEVRRPPAIDARRPLRGRTIVLDPGHPPAGATGPTGLWEPVATLAVAQKAAQLLRRAGATVLLTRTDMTPVDLFPRTHFAERHDADVLVSIHANALPDGVNPFVNNGTSVYYFQPRSTDLARALDTALVRQLGLRDLGIGRGDYALVRPTWMPAALTEGVFIMMPDQEALLASEAGQWRYARGIVEGIRAFLRERAAEP
jgi:N-acetylmuramoyl-L-alanine amidase